MTINLIFTIKNMTKAWLEPTALRPLEVERLTYSVICAAEPFKTVSEVKQGSVNNSLI